MSKLRQLIAREPVRVAYTAIIVLEAIASALVTALNHKPGNLGELALPFLTALAGELARGKVTPVTVSDEDSAVSAILGELGNVPAVSPYVEQVEHLIPVEERKKLEGLLTTTAEHELGHAIGLSDEDLSRLVELLQQRGLVATPAAAEVAPVTPPPIQTEPTPGQ